MNDTTALRRVAEKAAELAKHVRECEDSDWWWQFREELEELESALQAAAKAMEIDP